MKDESARRAYDLIYPSITRSHPSPETTQVPRSPPASARQSEALNEAAQIVALEKSTHERQARWRSRKNAFNSSILELQRDLRRLEHEIRNLDSIVAAEAAEDAQKNSWGYWLLSSLYKKVEDSEEEKARKDRGKQERRIEKDMKERRLSLKKADLDQVESQLRKANEEANAADLVEIRKIQVIRDRIRAREIRERQERERVERQRVKQIWKQQQEQREKEEREAAAAQTRQKERQASTTTCRHDGWWPKVQGRTACPECYQIWTYLLQCPGCKMKACAKCQGMIRRRMSRNAARTNYGASQRVPSPGGYYDF